MTSLNKSNLYIKKNLTPKWNYFIILMDSGDKKGRQDSESMTLFSTVWCLSWKIWMAGMWNHSEASSLACPVLGQQWLKRLPSSTQAWHLSMWPLSWTCPGQWPQYSWISYISGQVEEGVFHWTRWKLQAF